MQPGGFWPDLDGELAADPARWWPEVRIGALASRSLRDRRGEGFAGTAVDLLTSGESVLLVVAEVERRRRSLEAVVAGHASGPLAVASWRALAHRPLRGAPASNTCWRWTRRRSEAGLDVLSRAAGAGLAHLAWGARECDFTVAHWSSQLSLRPALVEAWRALSTQQRCQGEELRAALQGAGAYSARRRAVRAAG